MATSGRSSNWTESENETLMDLYVENADKLVGKFSSTVSSKKKKEIWLYIVESINCMGMGCRTVKSAKKRLSDVKGDTKKKERKIRSAAKTTGGGPPPSPLKKYEEKLVSILPDSVIEGIDGGFDTLSFQLDLNTNNADEVLNSPNKTKEQDLEANGYGSPVISDKPIRHGNKESEHGSGNQPKQTQRQLSRGSHIHGSKESEHGLCNQPRENELQLSRGSHGNKESENGKKVIEKPGSSSEQTHKRKDYQSQYLDLKRRRLDLLEKQLTMDETKMILEKKKIQTLGHILQNIVEVRGKKIATDILEMTENEESMFCGFMAEI